MVVCPECGAEMLLKRTNKYTYPNGTPRLFYGCPNYPECRGTHGAHPDGTPMGFPADEETKQWRIKAHEKFASFCHKWNYSKRDGYKLLQTMMSMTCNQAHISKFGKEECQKLIKLLTDYSQD